MADRAQKSEVPFTSYPSLPPWPEGVPLDDDFSLMEEMTNGAKTEADIVEIATSYRPNVLVIDCMMAASFRAAANLGFRRPFSVTSSTAPITTIGANVS